MPLSSVAAAASRGVNPSVHGVGKDTKDVAVLLGGGHDVSRPGTATTIHPYEHATTMTNNHTPSFTSGAHTVTSSGSGSTSGNNGNTTPPANATTTSLASYSTASLGTSESSDVHHHTGVSSHSHSYASSHGQHASSTKAREKELAKEREKEEKARKEREKREKKERERVAALPGLFAEVVLHGEVCGRTTVRKAVPSTNTGTSSSNNNAALNGGLGGVGAEWFENMLFPDLPSFENMLVMLWRATPDNGGSNSKREKEKEGKEKDDGRPRSSKGTETSSALSPTMTSSTTTTLASGSTSTGTSNARPGSSSAGGVVKKNSVFVGCVEISLPNFRRGEWVEGWWPLYANANAMGAVGGASGTSFWY